MVALRVDLKSKLVRVFDQLFRHSSIQDSTSEVFAPLALHKDINCSAYLHADPVDRSTQVTQTQNHITRPCLVNSNVARLYNSPQCRTAQMSVIMMADAWLDRRSWIREVVSLPVRSVLRHHSELAQLLVVHFARVVPASAGILLHPWLQKLHGLSDVVGELSRHALRWTTQTHVVERVRRAGLNDTDSVDVEVFYPFFPAPVINRHMHVEVRVDEQPYQAAERFCSTRGRAYRGSCLHSQCGGCQALRCPSLETPTACLKFYRRSCLKDLAAKIDLFKSAHWVNGDWTAGGVGCD